MENHGYPLTHYNFQSQNNGADLVQLPLPLDLYLPPANFYGPPLIRGIPENASNPVSSPAQGRKRAASVSSVGSVSPPATPSVTAPKKRGRGRPRKSESTKNTGSAPSKGTTAKAPSEKGKRKKKKTDENSAPPATATIELSDSEDEIEKTSDGKKRYWTDEEKTLFFKFLLAFDEAGEKRFEQHKKSPGHVYKRASELLFPGSRAPSSVKSLYARSLETFTWMLAFESFTGNGGGDPDTDDPAAICRSRLTAARKSGLTLGSLTPATITKWETNGWWDLFNDRLGTSAKVTREIERNSASTISDLEDDKSDDDTSETESKPARVPKTPAAIVSEPKHTPVSNFRKQTANSFGNIGEFMKMKMVTEEKRSEALAAKLEIEREKLELDKAKAKIDMAREVFAMDGTSAEVKAAANTFLLGLFS